jgi:drug/metabolite transporter (DMT)-like permease
MTDPGNGSARPGPAATGIALAVLSAGTFGTSGIFASALISTGWSPAAAAIARLAGSAFLLTIPAVLQLRRRRAPLRREAGRVMIYGLVAIAGGQLSYFNAIESIPIGIAVLLEYLGVVLVVGWLWAARGQQPGRLTVAGMVTAIAGLALLANMAGSSQLSPAGITWGLLEAVSLAAYFLLSAAAGEQVLPPLVMAWGGMCAGAAFLAAR